MNFLCYTSLATLGLTLSSDGGLIPLREHVDIHWNFEAGDRWTCEAKTVTAGEDVFHEWSDVFLPLDDKPVAEGGQRREQPASELFAFTGVEPGNPIWIAPQVQTGPNETWPGFNNYQSDGVFGSYQENDPRLAPEDQALSLPWIRVTYQGLSYQGSGQPAFSMWQTDSVGVPTVWFSTADTQNPDTFLMTAGAHVHLNWGFGAQGIYRIRLTASAYLGPGKTNPTGESAVQTVTFAVGPFAQWQAVHFNGTELDDTTICGMAADPDADGMNNLLEYAFGFDPRNGRRTAVSSGLGLPVFSRETDGGIAYRVLEYARRRAGSLSSPTGYVAEFSDLKNAGGWQAAETESVEDFTGEKANLNTDWEKVRARRAIPAGQHAAGFGRVRVTQSD